MSRKLLIPGTGASTYASSDGAKVGSIFDLALKHHHHLELEHDADPEVLQPRRTSGLQKDGQYVDISATGYIRAVYEWFEKAKLPSYQFWPYDWRVDMRLSGERLWSYLRDTDASSDKWDIVCHSQGGLVLWWASKLGGSEFRERVHRVVFAGVPIFGTVNAAAALLTGVDLLPGVSVKTNVVRTWASVYMMLPRWYTKAGATPSIDLLLNSTWSDASLLAPSASVHFEDGVDRRLLARARAWSNALANDTFEELRSVDRFVILQGKNHPTRVRAPAFPQLPELVEDEQSVFRGDGLVPTEMTYKLLPRVVRDDIDTFYTNVRSHMLFCSQRQTLELCESLFQ